MRQQSLSMREHQVLSQMAEGKTNAEIAATLWISVNTVKFHAQNIFEKLNVGSRTDAVATRLRESLSDPVAEAALTTLLVQNLADELHTLAAEMAKRVAEAEKAAS